MRHSARWGLAILIGITLFAGGCPDSRTLTIDVQTDFVPEVELGFVAVEVFTGSVPRGAGTTGRRVHSFEPVAGDAAQLRTGMRVAEVADLAPGTYTVRVLARRPAPAGARPDAGADLVERRVVTSLDANRVVRVVLSGSCAHVRCPGDGDADVAIECLNGECVDPRCDPSLPETAAYCCDSPPCTESAFCEGATDCPVASCVNATCVAGACIAVDRPGACASGEYCDRAEGSCLPIPGEMPVDAGPPDVGPADASVRDGGPPDVGPADAGSGDASVDTGPDAFACPAEICGNGLDDDCDGAPDCEDSECAGFACDDGDACTHTDVCVPMAMVGGPCAGTSVSCDSTDCMSRTCNGTPTCTEVPIVDGTACATDGNECTTDVCNAGACVHTERTGSCSDDANDCTTDVCFAGFCTHVTRNGEACTSDGNACTTDVCSGITCTHPVVALGTSCAGGICCGASCIDPLSDAANCGVCGLNCAAAGRTCRSGFCRCVGNGDCVTAGYGPLAGCFDRGDGLGNVCECHCPGMPVTGTCTGQCPAGTAHCRAIAGRDYCEY